MYMRKRYSDKFKLKIVTEYLEGPLGYKLLAKKYNIPSSTPIKRWVKAFKSFGIKGITNKHSRSVYPFQFKLDVLSFIKETGASYQDAAIKFNLNQPSLIARWNSTFLRKGIEGLKGKLGGSSSMSNKENKKQLKQRNIMSQKELERENELLRLEVAYLKKLKAFQENPNAYLEKHKQHWHSNSKKKGSN